MSQLNSRDLFQLYQDGHSEAAAAIYRRYVERLLALARQRIGHKLRRRLDAEDVVQSAYRSFFLHARSERYRLARSGDLWRLLSGITLHKLHSQVEKHTSSKRALDREEPAASSQLNPQAAEPSPAEVIALLETTNKIVESLSAEVRDALVARLQGQSMDEIGRTVGKSPRTVRRLIAEGKRQLEARLLDAGERHARQRLPTIELPGELLSHADFTLEKLIGKGGMGRVYRARESATGRKVTVKALHKARQADAQAVARFVQEAQILGSLSHPHIVGVRGLGRFPGGGLFMVMDFVDGSDLQTRLQDGPLERAEALRLIAQIAAAVHYAHEQGVIHCDLKPANILLDHAQQVVVTDFGFAHIIAQASAGAELSLGGTPGYIAPEILLHGGPPTVAADIYAIGMLLWTSISGQPPDELARRLRQGGAEDPLTAACLHCTAAAPTERYASAAELLQALQRLRGEHSLRSE